MSKVLRKADGSLLIDLARSSISSVFTSQEIEISDTIRSKFCYKSGVFVTLRKFGRLRGCVGFARTSVPLYASVVDAAKKAAFQDPRFSPLTEEELSKIEIEVSLLSEPEMLSNEDPSYVIKNLVVGKDGIIFSNDDFSGLVLPNMNSGQEWSVEDFLKYACTRLGFNEVAWLDPRSRLYKFRAKMFNEG